MSSKVVVTGGAGFIGSHLVESLLERGYRVTVLDDLSTGRRDNLENVARHVQLVTGSILDQGLLESELRGARAVFHLAAVPSVPRSLREPLLSHAVNATGTLMILEACRVTGVPRVVYAASSSAQGELGDAVRSEHLHGRPRSPYAVAKFCGELYGHVYHDTHGTEFVALRYFNVYGPRQRLRGPYSNVIPAFVNAALTGRQAVIYGDGHQTRDFTFVDDIVAASLLAMESEAAPGHTMNIGPGRAISIVELARAVECAVGRQMSVRHEPARPEDVLRMEADVRLARDILGFEASTTLDDGLLRTAEWWRRRLEACGP